MDSLELPGRDQEILVSLVKAYRELGELMKGSNQLVKALYHEWPDHQAGEPLVALGAGGGGLPGDAGGS